LLEEKLKKKNLWSATKKRGDLFRGGMKKRGRPSAQGRSCDKKGPSINATENPLKKKRGTPLNEKEESARGK